MVLVLVNFPLLCLELQHCITFFQFGTSIGEFPPLVLGTAFFFQAPGNLDQQDC